MTAIVLACLFWFAHTDIRLVTVQVPVHLLGVNRQKCVASYISSLGCPGLMCPYEMKHWSTFASMAV
jgi:hypothetical protein